jgi:hypothetical protein
MAPEDPSNLGLNPTDAHRSMDQIFNLAPSADWIVGPTSENGLKPTFETEIKFPIPVL